MAIFGIIFASCISSEPRAAHFRPVFYIGSMVDIQSAAAKIRRGKKEDRKKRNHGKNIMSASAMKGGHNKSLACNGKWAL